MRLIMIILVIGLTSFKANKERVGTASYYADKFEGRKTATGERFTQSGLTGASNNYRLGTVVRVTNLSNNKSVTIRINDRMAHSMSKKGRIVDVTKHAAKKLNFYKKGLTRVKVVSL